MLKISCKEYIYINCKKEGVCMSKEERLGEARTMNCGEIAFIVNYANCKDITVQFKITGEIVKTTYQNFKNGNVKSHFTPSVFGVGIIGNEKTKDENGELYDSYIRWRSMLRRCYSGEYQKRYPTYKGCTVCKEWLNYSDFKKWYDVNYYEIEGERMALDKDILVKGNKIYSPNTCVFVPQNINILFIKRNKARGKYPIGVYKPNNSNKYQAQCNTFYNGKMQHKYLGLYNTIEDAFNAYKKFKETEIKQIADEYKDKIPNKLYEAMYNYEVEITD